MAPTTETLQNGKESESGNCWTKILDRPRRHSHPRVAKASPSTQSEVHVPDLTEVMGKTTVVPLPLMYAIVEVSCRKLVKDTQATLFLPILSR